MSKWKKAVGYCMHSECEDYVKGHFLLNHGPRFYCPNCRLPALIVNEYGMAADPNDLLFREVRINFNFNLSDMKYTDTAIIRDDSDDIKDRNVYTLNSPLIKTEKRAFTIGLGILSNLDHCDVIPTDVPYHTEFVMSMDGTKTEWKMQLGKLQDRLARSHRANLRNGGK